MCPAFVHPATVWLRGNRFHNRSPIRLQSRVSLRISRRPINAAVQGWAETRLSIPSIDRFSTDSEDLALPGTHFAEPPSITAEDLLRLVRGETPDAWINEILHTLLGWRQLQDGEWNDDLVQQEWKEVYPDGPPDFIGKDGVYEPATDRPVRRAVQKLTRSIPSEYKQILREVLEPKGFPGWKLKELTPNRTRRAMAVNWILYWYRVHYPEYQWS